MEDKPKFDDNYFAFEKKKNLFLTHMLDFWKEHELSQIQMIRLLVDATKMVADTDFNSSGKS